MKDKIIEAAVKLASGRDYRKVGPVEVARVLKCHHTVVSKYTNSLELATAIVTAGVERGILRIVAYALVHNHPVALAAPVELRKRAGAFMMSGKL